MLVPVRVLRSSLRDAVRACSAADAEALAAAGLDRLDPEQVRVVLGHVVRSLVERSHADGVDAEDLSAILADVVRGAAWAPDLSVDAVVVVLTGAFGVHPEDPLVVPGVAPAAVLVVAHLLRPGEAVDAHLDAALAEVQRAETVEMP